MVAPKGHPPYPGCETGGRPLKFTDEFIENEADEFVKWMQLPTSIYFKRFALVRGYCPSQLVRFANSNEKFKQVYEQAKEWQQVIISENALTKVFSDGFSKFVLVNHHGWAEKSETKVTGDDQNPLSCILVQITGNTKELVNE